MAPGVRKLAALGASGKHKQNIERDLVRLVESQLDQKCRITFVDSYRRGPSNTAVRWRAPMFLPHELFAQIYSYSFDVFKAVFGLHRALSHVNWFHRCRR